MTTEPSGIQSEFLKTHRLGVLATGRRDGSPQQALVAYNYDGNDIAISTSDDSAKARNIVKRRQVSLLVTDGPKAVTVYGRARIVGGDAAGAYQERLATGRPGGGSGRPAQTRSGGERVIILIEPQKYFANRLES
jgi:PPOX class probable F420-dependent enzyme